MHWKLPQTSSKHGLRKNPTASNSNTSLHFQAQKDTETPSVKGEARQNSTLFIGNFLRSAKYEVGETGGLLSFSLEHDLQMVGE